MPAAPRFTPIASERREIEKIRIRLMSQIKLTIYIADQIQALGLRRGAMLIGNKRKRVPVDRDMLLDCLNYAQRRWLEYDLADEEAPTHWPHAV